VFLLRLGRTGCELSAILPIDSATQPELGSFGSAAGTVSRATGDPHFMQ